MPEPAAALLDATAVQAHPNAIGKFLRKLGCRYKQVAAGHRAAMQQGKAAPRGLAAAPWFGPLARSNGVRGLTPRQPRHAQEHRRRKGAARRRLLVRFSGKTVHSTLFLSLKLLPPYSPDLDGIEMAFAKLKADLRRIGARTFTELFKAIGQVCEICGPDECRNYLKAAGYVAG